MMSILKCRDLRGLNATGALVSLTFPTATGPPHPLLSSSPSPLSLSRSLPPPTPTLPSQTPRSTQEEGKNHRELPQEVIQHAYASWAGILVPISSALPGRAATRIRRPRAIDFISLPSVVSPGRPRSKDLLRLGLFASPSVGKEAPTLLESTVHFPLHNSKFSFGDGYQPVHFVLC